MKIPSFLVFQPSGSDVIQSNKWSAGRRLGSSGAVLLDGLLQNSNLCLLALFPPLAFSPLSASGMLQSPWISSRVNSFLTFKGFEIIRKVLDLIWSSLRYHFFLNREHVHLLYFLCFLNYMFPFTWWIILLVYGKSTDFGVDRAEVDPALATNYTLDSSCHFIEPLLFLL